MSDDDQMKEKPDVKRTLEELAASDAIELPPEGSAELEKIQDALIVQAYLSRVSPAQKRVLGMIVSLKTQVQKTTEFLMTNKELFAFGMLPLPGSMPLAATLATLAPHMGIDENSENFRSTFWRNIFEGNIDISEFRKYFNEKKGYEDKLYLNTDMLANDMARDIGTLISTQMTPKNLLVGTAAMTLMGSMIMVPAIGALAINLTLLGMAGLAAYAILTPKGRGHLKTAWKTAQAVSGTLTHHACKGWKGARYACAQITTNIMNDWKEDKRHPVVKVLNRAVTHAVLPLAKVAAYVHTRFPAAVALFAANSLVAPILLGTAIVPALWLVPALAISGAIFATSVISKKDLLVNMCFVKDGDGFFKDIMSSQKTLGMAASLAANFTYRSAWRGFINALSITYAALSPRNGNFLQTMAFCGMQSLRITGYALAGALDAVTYAMMRLNYINHPKEFADYKQNMAGYFTKRFARTGFVKAVDAFSKPYLERTDRYRRFHKHRMDRPIDPNSVSTYEALENAVNAVTDVHVPDRFQRVWDSLLDALKPIKTEVADPLRDTFVDPVRNELKRRKGRKSARREPQKA